MFSSCVAGISGPIAAKKVLVLQASAVQGKSVANALLAESDKFIVYGTTRTTDNKAKLEKKGCKLMVGSCSSKEFVKNALKIAAPESVFFTTHSGPEEVQEGKMIIDCIKAAGVQHVIYSSVLNADSVPILAFKAKFEVENYLRVSGLNFTILRPASLLETLTNREFHSFFYMGKLKGYSQAKTKVSYVASKDIGTVSAKVFHSPSSHLGATIECVGFTADGITLAQNLSEASGVKCTYSVRYAGCLSCFLPRGTSQFVSFLDSKGYSSTEKSVPIFMDLVNSTPTSALECFAGIGKWENGEKFKSKTTVAKTSEPSPSV